MDDRSKLVNNERLKLLATFLNGLGITMFAVGALAPLVSSMDKPSGLSSGAALTLLVCFLGSCSLHYGASTVLKGLRP